MEVAEGFEQAVADFTFAFDEMKRQSSALDRKVEAEMKERMHSIPLLMDLVELLPRSYRNARRIYEQVERLHAGEGAGDG